jgi:sialic acid synthase SpsE
MKPIKIIAEIAQAHDGSLGILHSYIDALATTGVDAIKFQTHIAEAESSEYEQFRVNFSYVDKTRFDYWKRMEFSIDQWKEIKQHCDKVGLEFMSSPFSNKAVDYLEEIGVNQYKVGSGEISNLLLLNRLSETGKPVILSSGLSDWDELETAINFLQSKNTDVSILQCTTQYPTSPEIKKYIHSFSQKGKIMSSERKFSDDKLEFSSHIIFDSKDSFLELISDLFYHDNVIIPNKQYNFENNILNYWNEEEL